MEKAREIKSPNRGTDPFMESFVAFWFICRKLLMLGHVALSFLRVSSKERKIRGNLSLSFDWFIVPIH